MKESGSIRNDPKQEAVVNFLDKYAQEFLAAQPRLA
jgi:hypothetical protein